jgi:Na+/H+ antiporter NhaD/arsenite permease-like protein
LVVCLAVFAFMVAMFIVGEYLAVPVSPPAAALFGAALILLVIHETGIDSVSGVLRDVDWETLLFYICIFALVGALDRTGVLAALGSGMVAAFGNDLTTATLVILFAAGLVSSVIPNVPLVVAMVPLLSQYVVGAGLAAPAAVQAGYTQLPAEVLPLYFAMMYGGTLGGNCTMLGGGANIVAAGICRRNDRPFTFFEFLRYGAPVMLVQLLVSAAYVHFRFG